MVISRKLCIRQQDVAIQKTTSAILEGDLDPHQNRSCEVPLRPTTGALRVDGRRLRWSYGTTGPTTGWFRYGFAYSTQVAGLTEVPLRPTTGVPTPGPSQEGRGELFAGLTEVFKCLKLPIHPPPNHRRRCEHSEAIRRGLLGN